MNENQKNNGVALIGEIVSNFKFDHEVSGEGFYTAMLVTMRLSGQVDIIPIMVSDRLVDVKADWINQLVEVLGQFRSCNKNEDKRNHLVLSVFTERLNKLEYEYEDKCDENLIFLDGYICKQPNYRKTPLGREIANILLKVKRPCGKSDYIPCIAWDKNARFANGLAVGTRLQIKGRIQSREYNKIVDGICESRTAYEVSVNELTVIKEIEESERTEE